MTLQPHAVRFHLRDWLSSELVVEMDGHVAAGRCELKTIKGVIAGEKRNSLVMNSVL